MVITLIVLVKLFLPEPQNNRVLIQQFWSTKTHAGSDYDVVVCGDSRVYRGISVEDILLDQEVQLSGINLGYAGAGLSNSYIDFALSKFRPDSRLKILIVGVTPNSLTKKAFENESLNEYLAEGEFEELKHKYLSGMLKYFAPFSLLELIKMEESNYQEKYMDGGWVASSYLMPDSNSALFNYSKRFTSHKVSDAELDSFLEKMKVVSEQGVVIIAFRPPSTYQMRRLEDSLSGFNEELIKQKLVSNSIAWLDFKDRDYNSYDGSHLNKNQRSGFLGTSERDFAFF